MRCVYPEVAACYSLRSKRTRGSQCAYTSRSPSFPTTTAALATYGCIPCELQIMLEPPEYEGLDDDYDPSEGYSDGMHKWIAVRDALRVWEKHA